MYKKYTAELLAPYIKRRLNGERLSYLSIGSGIPQSTLSKYTSETRAYLLSNTKPSKKHRLVGEILEIIKSNNTIRRTDGYVMPVPFITRIFRARRNAIDLPMIDDVRDELFLDP